MANRPDAIVSSRGCGCFLDPPTFPTHFREVETDRDRRPEDRGSASISYAAKHPDLFSPGVGVECAAMLQRWHDTKPPIDDPDTQDWILQVLGYFRSCYIPDSGSRNVSDLLILKDADPLAMADRHAGVALIRELYPDFTPTAAHFTGAYWGTRPTP